MTISHKQFIASKVFGATVTFGRGFQSHEIIGFHDVQCMLYPPDWLLEFDLTEIE